MRNSMHFSRNPFRMRSSKKTGVGAFPRFRSSQLSTPHLPPHSISHQKRLRPSRSDGGSCEKGVPSSGEKLLCRDSVVRGRRRRRRVRRAVELPHVHSVPAGSALRHLVIRWHLEERRIRLRLLNIRQGVGGIAEPWI